MTHPRGRILFVDDEEMLIKVVPRMLRHIGFEVEYARSGVEAVDKYKNAMDDGSRFDLVIMDLCIPGELNGQEAMRRILDIDPAARGIASSGYVMSSMAATYQENGFKGSIAKPYTADELRRVLDEFFEPSGPPK